MTRIAIIGNAGGGKSTVSRKQRDRLKLPQYAVDAMQWRPGWQSVPKEEFADQHAKALKEDRWIIDGWGEFQFIEERFREADTIVLIDYPLWRHYHWALKRQFWCIFHPRIDGLPGCPMLPMTWRFLKMIWFIDRRVMPKLRRLVASHRTSKRVFEIRSLSQLRSFYTEAESSNRLTRR